MFYFPARQRKFNLDDRGKLTIKGGLFCYINKVLAGTLVIFSFFSSFCFAYPEAEDFNERFERMAHLISYITFKDVSPLNIFIESTHYNQEEVNYNFDVLLDQLEEFIKENYNKGYIYKK